jgi:hypothetical protein
MNLLKFLYRQPKNEALLGGKTMEQRLKDYEIRTMRDKMRRYPERYRNSGRMLLAFE